MYIQEFPDCCAGDIISRFGHTATGMERRNFNAEQIADYINTHSSNKENVTGFLMITLNQDQIPVIGPVLRKLKFRCIAKQIFHPGHVSFINIYLREMSKAHYLNPNRKVKPKAKK